MTLKNSYYYLDKWVGYVNKCYLNKKFKWHEN